MFWKIFLTYSARSDIIFTESEGNEVFFNGNRWKREPKVKSGEHYTAEWWQKKLGLNSIQKTAARLNLLARKNIVEKVSVGEYEIVRFMPTAMFCENDIITMLKETQFIKTNKNA